MRDPATAATLLSATTTLDSGPAIPALASESELQCSSMACPGKYLFKEAHGPFRLDLGDILYAPNTLLDESKVRLLASIGVLWWHIDGTLLMSAIGMQGAASSCTCCCWRRTMRAPCKPEATLASMRLSTAQVSCKHHFVASPVLKYINITGWLQGRVLLWAWLQERRDVGGTYTYAGCLSLPRELWIVYDRVPAPDDAASASTSGGSSHSNVSGGSGGGGSSAAAGTSGTMAASHGRDDAQSQHQLNGEGAGGSGDGQPGRAYVLRPRLVQKPVPEFSSLRVPGRAWVYDATATAAAAAGRAPREVSAGYQKGGGMVPAGMWQEKTDAADTVRGGGGAGAGAELKPSCGGGVGGLETVQEEDQSTDDTEGASPDGSVHHGLAHLKLSKGISSEDTSGRQPVRLTGGTADGFPEPEDSTPSDVSASPFGNTRCQQTPMQTAQPMDADAHAEAHAGNNAGSQALGVGTSKSRPAPILVGHGEAVPIPVVRGPCLELQLSLSMEAPTRCRRDPSGRLLPACGPHGLPAQFKPKSDTDPDASQAGLGPTAAATGGGTPGKIASTPDNDDMNTAPATSPLTSPRTPGPSPPLSPRANNGSEQESVPRRTEGEHPSADAPPPLGACSGLLFHSWKGSEGEAAVIYNWESGVLEVIFAALDPASHMFSLAAPGCKRVGGTLRARPTPGQPLRLHVFVDASLMEVFTGGVKLWCFCCVCGAGWLACDGPTPQHPLAASDTLDFVHALWLALHLHCTCLSALCAPAGKAARA